MSIETVDLQKAKYAFIISMLGLGGVIAIILFLIFTKYGNASSDIVAIVGTITGLVGTIVGAFLGVQAGADGKPALMLQLKETQALLNRALVALPKKEAEKLLPEGE